MLYQFIEGDFFYLDHLPKSQTLKCNSSWYLKRLLSFFKSFKMGADDYFSISKNFIDLSLCFSSKNNLPVTKKLTANSLCGQSNKSGLSMLGLKELWILLLWDRTLWLPFVAFVSQGRKREPVNIPSTRHMTGCKDKRQALEGTISLYFSTAF